MLFLVCFYIPFLFQWKCSCIPYMKVKVKSLSRVRLFATPWAVAYQASPSMGFSRQEYWSGLPFPSPGDLPHPGIEPRSLALQADALPSELPGKPPPHSLHNFYIRKNISLYNFLKSNMNKRMKPKRDIDTCMHTEGWYLTAKRLLYETYVWLSHPP